jgi:tetratricopeptide (TPR) repeat protein
LNKKWKSYIDVVNETIEFTPFKSFLEGNTDISEKANIANTLAIALFYLGHLDKAREASYAYSVFEESKIPKIPREINRLRPLYEAALYRDLSGRKNEAKDLWKRFVEIAERIPEDQILKERRANYLVQTGYGLAKLDRFDEAIQWAERGQKAIRKGLGTFTKAVRNTPEYGLVEVIRAIQKVKIDNSKESRLSAQQALQVFKDASSKHSRLGYKIVFDLQQSYPDLFKSVLPDPEND